MSMTEDEARYEQWMEDLYAEHSKKAVEEFTAERLQSFYIKNPLLAQPALAALVESRALLISHPAAALVFAATATEVGLKEVLLKPVVFGMVHSESAASLITELTVSHSCVERFRDLLYQILSEHGGVDLGSFARPSSSKKLWEEIREIQKRRNVILHRAEQSSVEDARQSIDVASAVLETLFPAVATHLGLHIHDGFRVCNQAGCRYGLNEFPANAHG